MEVNKDTNTTVLGVDVGATGIKGAPIDLDTGKLVTDRKRLLTPKPATPQAVARVFTELIRMHDYQGPIGCGFPSVIKNGVVHTAANIASDWIGQDASALLSDACGQPVFILNDADAAGMAEMQFGAGKELEGVVMLITIGTGLGSALFVDGKLIPNTELGHLIFQGDIAENYASNRARKDEGLQWQAWGQRFNAYLHHLNRLFTVDHFLLSGGISKKFDQYQAYLDIDVPVEPAQLLNNAGTVGAAIFAAEQMSYSF